MYAGGMLGLLQVTVGAPLSMGFVHYRNAILEDVEENRARDLTVTELHVPESTVGFSRCAIIVIITIK